MIWFLLIALIFLSDWLAIHLHKTDKVHLWLSSIGMIFSAPLIGFLLGFVFLQFSRIFDPTSTHEGAGYGGVFIMFGLLANAIVFLIAGLIVKINRYYKYRQT
ncbi:hypothetical protein [Pontibacillus yanchengensis]|uniref:Inner-membrane translocator n=1 Tax=Pontibacillus yanchengensis Y32 TaxID=1385514 RepID=A0A0A2TJK5_9BACI|nr:hypothetical protein [Pontibacillus yanchengensis]KGP74618.1 inner-membrane translocator [Pontibacillus yanchengensis Y32]